MINKNYLLSMIGAAVAFPLFVSAQIFVDTFDSDSSSDYDIFMGRDTSTVTFGWDYSQMGIPSAPRTTDGSTLGLLTVANDPARGGSLNEAVTLIPKISVTGDFKMTFDLWMNYRGSVAGGGPDSTEQVMIGHGITGSNYFGNGTPGDGTYLHAGGDGYGSFVIYEDDVPLDDGPFNAGSRAFSDPYYAGFGGHEAPSVQQGSTEQDQTGISIAGALGFHWRTIELERIGDTTTWTIDGLLIATVENASTSADTVFFGHWDNWDGAAGLEEFQFHVIDNLEIIPEPSTYAAIIGVLALIGAAFIRRRKA